MKRKRVPMALIHHANQYLITDGYNGRQGFSQIVDGFAEVLALHEKHRLPAGLHLSGTLIEAAAWCRPQFLRYVRSLFQRNLLSPVGGTHAENVMPLFSPEFNRRQLREFFWLCETHLGVKPSSLTTCWIPERVWDTDRLAPVLASPELPNGGYRQVLLDDRLVYPWGGRYEGSRRAKFDAEGPYGVVSTHYTHREHAPRAVAPRPETCRPYLIERGHGLLMLPISANLRYWVPPSSPGHWRLVEQAIEAVAAASVPDAILVYADDLEKTAGVGGWDGSALRRYDDFLRWLESRPDLEVVRLPDWLHASPKPETRPIQSGTFYELAQAWGAGENYRGWWDDPAWAPSRHHLERCEEAVRGAEEGGGEERLTGLAWKHLMASSYETAWHDHGGLTVAAWSRALASHARAALVMAAAARYFSDAAPEPRACLADVDEDGQEETLLASHQMFAIFSSRDGGRLLHLYCRSPLGASLVIGNPSDDWNLQEDLHRYMEQPANHPGALADVGFEHDRYEVSALRSGSGGVFLEMTNVQEDSPMASARKSVLLLADSPALLTCYRLPGVTAGLDTETCLSPDYYRLLRDGRSRLRNYDGATWRGFQNGDTAVWLAAAPDEEQVAFLKPQQPRVGHGLNLRVGSTSSHFHILIGCGPTSVENCRALFHKGRKSIHRLAAEVSGVASGSA